MKQTRDINSSGFSLQLSVLSLIFLQFFRLKHELINKPLLHPFAPPLYIFSQPLSDLSTLSKVGSQNKLNAKPFEIFFFLSHDFLSCLSFCFVSSTPSEALFSNLNFLHFTSFQQSGSNIHMFVQLDPSFSHTGDIMPLIYLLQFIITSLDVSNTNLTCVCNTNSIGICMFSFALVSISFRAVIFV